MDRLVIQDRDRQGITVNGKPLSALRERERVIKTASIEDSLKKLEINWLEE